MAKGCRDCDMCTRTCLETWGWLLLNLVTAFIPAILRGIANMNSRKCPQCGHPLKYHQKREDGSFKD